MNSQTTPKTTGTWRSRVLGAFNLNDGRWGRDESSQNKPDIHNSTPPEENKPPQQPPPNNNRPTGNGPPDLDELWRDFNKKLSGFFGSPKKGGGGGEPPVGGKPPSLNFNIGKYNAKVPEGKQQFTQLMTARERAKNVKRRALETLDQELGFLD